MSGEGLGGEAWTHSCWQPSGSVIIDMCRVKGSCILSYSVQIVQSKVQGIERRDGKTESAAVGMNVNNEQIID